MLAELLTHRCTIKRAPRLAGVLNEAIGTPVPIATDVPCLYQARQERRVIDDAAEGLTVTRYWLFVPAGQDIRAGDQVTDLATTAGDTIAGTYQAKAALPQDMALPGLVLAHHVEIELERLS